VVDALERGRRDTNDPNLPNIDLRTLVEESTDALREVYADGRRRIVADGANVSNAVNGIMFKPQVGIHGGSFEFSSRCGIAEGDG